MVTSRSSLQEPDRLEIKQVPQDPAARAAIRGLAAQMAPHLDHSTPPRRDRLSALGTELLEGLGLPDQYLGFAMVALNNAFWREQFQAIPLSRRLLLLPKCLRDASACTGRFDSVGLHCGGCGACPIHGLKTRAEGLGYSVIVAEGTSSVIMKVLDGDADAILGVACMESLEKSFTAVADLGVPNQAIPLLFAGCADTEAELDLVVEHLHAQGGSASEKTHSPVPLMRETVRMFEEPLLSELLAAYVVTGSAGDTTAATDAIALDWLRYGGKRFRPFVTVAAYAVSRHGVAALEPHAPTAELIPLPVRRLALSIEALHKASLVHDDIEDDDGFRYGRPTLHRTHGTNTAINVGDWLVGLGYRLTAGEKANLGADCVADILEHLAGANLQLCRGQGAELLSHEQEASALRPVDALRVGALKTAPAFEVALYAGLRAAGPEVAEGLIKRFSTYLGEAYQVLNDLDNWRADGKNKVSLGQDVLVGRPTILRAFTIEAGGWNRLTRLSGQEGRKLDSEEVVARVRELYEELGAFDKAERLLRKLRERALEIAASAGETALAELLTFLVRTVLRDAHEPHDSPGA